MSVTAKDQYENLLIERSELKREVEKYKMERVLIDMKITALKCDLADAQAKCAEMRSCIAWLNSHRQSPLETAWNDHVQHALSTDCGKDYVSRAVVAQLSEALNYTAYHRLPLGDKVIDTLPDPWDEKVFKALAAAKSLEVL